MDMRFHGSEIADVAHRIGAVVRKEHHEGIVLLAAFFEVSLQLADVLIDVLNHGEDAGDGVLVLVAFVSIEDGLEVGGLVVGQ